MRVTRGEAFRGDPGSALASPARSTWASRLLLRLGLAAFIVAGACDGIIWEHSEAYDNGQFRVLPGRSSPAGGWEGPWLWFNRDGTVMYSEVFDGRAYNRTGFYQKGVKIRDLTEEEMNSELERIRRYLARTGQDASERLRK